MNRQVLLAAGVAALVGGITGFSCTTPQPAAECGFQTPYWAQFSLVDAGTGGSCAAYEGDLIEFERYAPPGGQMSFAALSARVGTAARVNPCSVDGMDGKFFRPETSDGGKESVLGSLSSSYPDNAGFCSSTGTIAPSLQVLPAVTFETCVAQGMEADNDGGYLDNGAPGNTFPVPAVTIGEAWSNFRILSTARFVQNIWEADMTVQRDGCSATYHVTGVYPAVGCTTDVNCDPKADIAAGRAVGSGISPDFMPKCVFFKDPKGYEAATIGKPGICMPTVSMDELAKLK